MLNLERETVRKQLFQDDYLDISFKRYVTFKQSDFYDEQYKREVLDELNQYFSSHTITEANVDEIAEKVRRDNPTTGSFVHWSNTADLLEFAQAQPGEVAKLWNQLYDDSLPLKDRIAHFRTAGQSFKEDISLGAPLFGYLLAAYNYEKYPLYKQEIFQEIKHDYGIQHTLGSVSEVYDDYVIFCEELLSWLQTKDSQATMLDVQDFIYCSTRYDKTRVETAAEYLYKIAQKIERYMRDPAAFLDTIKQLDPDVLQERHEFYRNNEKINKIRFLLLEKIREGQDVSITHLEKIKQRINDEYDTNILQAWTNFSILFQIYYPSKKAKVQRELLKIHEGIRNIPELAGMDFVQNKTLNGFDWNNTFGTDRAWLAVYEEKYTNHQAAVQYFIFFSGEEFGYGLHYGSDHPNSGKKDIVTIKDNESFTYESFREKFVDVYMSMQQVDDFVDNRYAKNHFNTEDMHEVETWEKMLQNENIVTPTNLEYLYKMLELGGEATPSELGEQFGVDHEVVNGSIVHLAQRIQEHTNAPFPKNSKGGDCHWCVLFTGEYKDGSHLFIWKLKENLKAALEYLDYKPSIPAYGKNEFLEEVFIEEELYNTMVNLLDYKRNIILQGPPGVGKTFVSKRLAYSMIGEKDHARVEMIQFHQNYAYEDFVMGFRPDGKGGFSMQYGIFYDFCKRALVNPENDYYFIIDEINRGNLSKIFGELFMLIEKDKRDNYVTMSYSKESFTVPDNIYLIGTMNTADRSLAQLEVALRRRFAFITLDPQFNEKWKNYMLKKGISDQMIERILTAIEKINTEIHDDFQLGRGYEIGHSFFTSTPEDVTEKVWFQHIIEYELKPLLEEYYFDRSEKVTTLLEGM